MSRRSRRNSRFEARGRLAKRDVDQIEEIETFLIVCEGAKTEPNYFRRFRVPTKVIRVEGLGDNTISLVRRTISLRDLARDDYDQVWVVFDRDSFPKERFNNAIQLAHQEGVQVAYSNEAFELWYLLHFHYYDSGISRQQYAAMLSGMLGYPYKKNSETIHEELLSKQDAAIRNARRLLDQYTPPKPSDNNPSTTVHLLVQALRKNSR